MKQKIAIIGTGHVGSALEKGITRSGYEVRTAKQGETQASASWAEVIFLAVPFGALQDVVRDLGSAAHGKSVVDLTNALNREMQLALGYTTSGAEELQKLLPRARVVKAFNTVFARYMSEGNVNGQQITNFAASDDAEARKTVLEIERAIGFDAVDAGPLKNARYLEPLGMLNIQLAFSLGMGANFAVKLVR